jgi:AmmeMemoRadiSam system protein A
MTVLGDDDRAELLQVAADAIASELRGDGCPRPLERGAPLGDPGASFVTLERGSQLLGCIGTIEPEAPLVEDVARNARQSAFADPRLPPVTAEDYREMSIKISVLSPLEEMPAASLEDVLAWVRPGVDGLLITVGSARATFLPSVWAQLPSPVNLLEHLLIKAGLPGRHWPEGIRVRRYTTDEFGAEGPRPGP